MITNPKPNQEPPTLTEVQQSQARLFEQALHLIWTELRQGLNASHPSDMLMESVQGILRVIPKEARQLYIGCAPQRYTTAQERCAAIYLKTWTRLIYDLADAKMKGYDDHRRIHKVVFPILSAMVQDLEEHGRYRFGDRR